MTRTHLKLSVALVMATVATGCARPSARALHSTSMTRASQHVVDVALTKLADRTPTATPVAQPNTAPTAAPAINPTPPAPIVDVAAPLKVKRLVIASGVKGREPVAAATSFAVGAQRRIYAYVEIANPERANSEIFVSFVPPSGVEAGRVRLRVGTASRWRTWAYTRLATKPGSYQVIVRDARGKALSRATFEITAAAPSV